MKFSEEKIKGIINKALVKEKIISIQTYYLSDYGEMLLRNTLNGILKHFKRDELMDVVYSAAKELILNATKSNYKRVIFEKNNLSIDNDNDYQKGMKIFKESMTEENLKKNRNIFKEKKYHVVATFYYREDVLRIKVKNNFPLHPIEEKRIREKFKASRSFSNLIDFYLEYSDNTEGAGLGITMVGILLDETGIDKHSYSLYSNEEYQETQAKLEIPLIKSYVPKRKRFELEFKTSNLSKEEFRKSFN